MPDFDPLSTLTADALATMSEAELVRTLRLEGGALAGVAQTMAANPRSTIEPHPRLGSDAPGQLALAGLGLQRDERGIASGLEMGRTIGEGGMGIVRLATQRSLGRQVAVKTLREAGDQASTLRLLREAWVTGSLEHPNIVPVYDLGLDENGSPIIVLKRIEGVEWAAIIANKVAVRERYGADDLLEYNLRILIQLCNAVKLAHARGILHRDLKPENVMIGSFGEVYLVDWGIAVSLVADPTGRTPQAKDQAVMAGTPSYMAPEMLGGAALTERTDVYLLGAILHEILTGAPPHEGTFRQIIASIVLSCFDFASDVPIELAALAKRALAPKPEDRFASAEELRQRLEWYLRHRGSLALSAEASRRRAEMEELIASGASIDTLHERLYRLFAEARFGFKQALAASPDNESARVGLRAAIEAVVRYELGRGAAEAAAGALAELEDPPPELSLRVSEALAARADAKKRIERLEQLGADLDSAVGRRTRALASGILGLVWTAGPQVVGAVVASRPSYPHWVGYIWTVTAMLIAVALVAWGWESLTKTLVNRRMIAAVFVVFAAQLVLQLAGHLMGLPAVAIETLHLFVWGACLAGVAGSFVRLFWIPVAGYFIAFILAAMWPVRRWDLMSLSNFVVLVTFLVAWWRPREDSLGARWRRKFPVAK